MPLLQIKELEKAYRYPVLRGLELTLFEGQATSLIGASGSGKSTLFNLIAGLEKPDKGTILLDKTPISLGKVAYMQQKDLLLPYAKIIDNCTLPLILQKQSRKEAQKEAIALLEQVGLEHLAQAYPAELSGGMRQRIAFVRTLLTKQKLILLDEPFAALDAISRQQLQSWYLDLAKTFGLTTFLITHDLDEALILSERVLLLRDGQIVRDYPVDKVENYQDSTSFLADKKSLYQSLLKGDKDAY